MKALEQSHAEHTHDFEVKCGQRLETVAKSLYEMCVANLVLLAPQANQMYTSTNKNLMYFTLAGLP